MKQIILKSNKYGEKTLLIDDKDFNYISTRRWCISQHGKEFYVRSTTKPRVFIHRFIINISDSNILIDHKDHNPFNNQRDNLRIATRSENNANRVGRGKSKYLGVFFRDEPHKNYTKLWTAKIVKNKKVKCLGTFKTQEEAALAYNEAAAVIHGEFANLNVL